MLRKTVRFCKTYGILETFKRVWKRYVIPPQSVLFYVDLNVDKRKDSFTQNISKNISVEGYSNINDIPEDVIKHIIKKGTVYNRKIEYKGILLDFLETFFKRGGIFWLARYNDIVVGYQWSIIGGGNLRFHLLPITPQDAIIQGVEIFPDYRGRGINPVITEMLLCQLKNCGISRVYLDAEISNKSSLKSFSKAYFKKIGIFRMRSIFGKCIVIWDKDSLNLENEE